MKAEELRAAQAPLKQQYRERPETAQIIHTAQSTIGEDVTCDLQTSAGAVQAGLHPAAGGDGSTACSADMLLQALVACAGVTLASVATAMGIELRSGTVRAEGLVDFRGTLGVDKETPVGFQRISLTFDLDTDATEERLATLIRLTERYCVVSQTLQHPPALQMSLQRASGGAS